MHYNYIEGVEGLGNGKRTNNLLKYPFVFMVQGVSKAWNQPLAYYITRNGVSVEVLEQSYGKY